MSGVDQARGDEVARSSQSLCKRCSSWYGRQWSENPYRTYVAHVVMAFLLTVIILSSLSLAHSGPSVNEAADITYSSKGGGLACLISFIILAGAPIAHYLIRRAWPKVRLEDFAGKDVPVKTEAPVQPPLPPNQSVSSPPPLPPLPPPADSSATREQPRASKPAAKPASKKKSPPHNQAGTPYNPYVFDFRYSLVPEFLRD